MIKTPFVFRIDETDPAALFAAFAGDPYSLLFDSTDAGHELSRYSYIAIQPFETIEARDGVTTVTNREQQLSLSDDPFEIVRERLEGWGYSMEEFRDDLPPFQGGAAGYFGYDLARSIEVLPDTAKHNPRVPDMAIGLYDMVVAFDHKKDRAALIVLARDEEQAKARYQHFLKLKARESGPAGKTGIDGSWTSDFTRKDYEAAVQKIIDYIYAGDIFQANMSQRFSASLPEGFDSYAHYRKLREINAAPFAAYMNFGGIVLSSASPEQFLTVHDRQVQTRPIKGTRRRVDNPAQDEALREELLNSEKDRAENTMIVDLLRNDLSKVCEDFSIKVLKLCNLESFATVHHLVSTVKGVLRADQSPVDLLRACFPGGSITGAPKVRAMEIIEELEPARRGPYCGAMGYIGFNGAMESNIMIRTLVYDGRTVSFNVGGGIVADSNPADEYQETLDKAAAIFKSFEPHATKGKTGTGQA